MTGENICVICSRPTTAVHHVDGDQDNNAEKNLVPACPGCNNKIHAGSTPRTLPWHAKLPGCSRRRRLPKFGVNELNGLQKTAFQMDEYLEAAYRTAHTRMSEAEPRPTGERYRISGVRASSAFARRFKSNIVAHRTGNCYEHRTTPAVLDATDAEYVLSLPAIDDIAGTTTRAKAAYSSYLASIDSKQGLRGHGGSIEGYQLEQ